MAGRVLGLPDHVAVALVSVTAGLGMVSVQSSVAPALAPSDVAPPAVQHDVCFRSLSDVIWGFLVTLLACSVAYWGRNKYTQSTTWEKIRAAFWAVFVPARDLQSYIQSSISYATIIWKYQQSRQPLQSLSRRHQFRELWSWLSPFSKFPGRILFLCDIVVYVEKESPLLKIDRLWSVESRVKVESEAMVIGEVAVGKTKDEDYERKELTRTGKVALLLAEVLPEYDELKFLRGNSGFGMLAIAIQALGYIIAVVSREVKDLPVAPLEVVGLILNIILLIQVSVFSFFNPCYRPLVIYTNSKREEKVLETVAIIKEFSIPWNRIFKVSLIVRGVVGLCLCGVVVYFIVTLTQVSNIFVVLSLIVYAIVFIISIINNVKVYFFGNHDVIWNNTISWFITLINIFVYTWALVVTILYWKSQNFNVQAELFNISQLIPFIG